MRTVLVDITNVPSIAPAEIASIDIGAVAPNVGDVIVYPDKGTFKVVQRAFVFEEQKSVIQVVGVTPKRSIEVIMQVACVQVINQEVQDDAAN